MNYTHDVEHDRVERSLRPRSAAGSAVALASLGALAGAAMGAWFATSGWSTGPMVTTPTLALAGSLAAFHPHRRIRLRTFDRRIAQALGTLALSLLVAGAITGHPMVVASSLWAMTTTTILVVTLAPPEN